MSNYTKATNFAIKDGLVTTDPAKIIKGTEIDNEYNAISNAIASKADVNSPALTGTPTAPTATVGSNTTQLATTAFVKAEIASYIPSGVILLWSGSVATIPSGWVLCNGSNSTPDLRNRFVVGAGSTYSVGGTGGSADATLVSHTHTFSGTTSGQSADHYHNFSFGRYFTPQYGGEEGFATGNYAGSTNASTTYPSNTSGTTSDHSHSYSGTTSSSGSSATNANLPPYYALAYIMKS